MVGMLGYIIGVILGLLGLYWDNWGYIGKRKWKLLFRVEGLGW